MIRRCRSKSLLRDRSTDEKIVRRSSTSTIEVGQTRKCKIGCCEASIGPLTAKDPGFWEALGTLSFLLPVNLGEPAGSVAGLGRFESPPQHFIDIGRCSGLTNLLRCCRFTAVTS